jgi:hypothetical protein
MHNNKKPLCENETEAIIQLNSILTYVRANLTVQRPIMKRARVTKRNKTQKRQFL